MNTQGFFDSSAGWSSGTGAEVQPEKQTPEPGSDAAITREVYRMLFDVQSMRLPGENFTFDVETTDGVVKVIGSTDSVMLNRHLNEALPRLKAVQGVKSVDISGFSKP